MTTAVITVPAAFGALQCEATARAAALAGLEEAPLLQEPIAAAIGYGVRPGSANQRWLVFDLGGGTLDIAVVSTREGRLNVLEHRGNNLLGGKDIDRSIVEHVLLPALEATYDLRASTPNAARSALVPRLRIKAEEAKIDLSTDTQVVVSLFDLGKDDSGEPIEMEIPLARAQLDALMEPLLEKCCILAREALAGARLTGADLDRILLVGGPTHSVEVLNPGGEPALDPVFSKGTPLPTEKTVKYRATRALVPDNPDSDLAIKLWEGEFLDDPDANEWVGNVLLSHDGVRRSVPEGAEIEVTIQVNASRLITVEAFVPHLNQHCSGRLYVPQREEQDCSNLSHAVVSETQTYRQRLEELERTSSNVDDESTQTELEDLRRDLDELDAKAPSPSSTPGKADPDDARRIVEESKTIRGRLGRLERRAAGRRSPLDNTQFAELVEIAAEVVGQFGTSLEKQQLAMLRRELERAASKGDDKAIQRICGEIDGLRWRVLFKHDWFWSEIFNSLRQPDTPFIDPAEAQRLIARGQAAISRGDGEGLREVVRALWKLQPKGNAEATRERAVRSGLRKF